jgi:hypothetical protein
MKSTLMLTTVIGLTCYTLIIGGCKKTMPVQPTIISYAEARDALIETITASETSYPKLKHLLPHLSNVQPMELKDLIVPGYECVVRRQDNRFSISYFGRSILLLYSGKFERNRAGKWSAIIMVEKELTDDR